MIAEPAVIIALSSFHRIKLSFARPIMEERCAVPLR
jgi:hypothetical protein